jgi:hypothetical protein
VVTGVLDRPRPVTTVPRWRGLQARVADALPRLGVRAAPLAVALGRRTQRRLRTEGRDGDSGEAGTPHGW